MTLRTRLGNLGNILDESPDQCDHLLLDSPVVTNAEWHAIIEHLGDKAVEIDCTFGAEDGPEGMRAALDRIRSHAEQAVRGGCEHVMLTDRNSSKERVPLPMVLATGAVHSHLVRQQLRTFTSVNVASGECLDVHHFAVLIGVGATTINAYAAEWTIAERHQKGLLEGVSLSKAVANYRKAIEDGLLKIMSKMGISVIASYRGGYNFEALGLSPSPESDFAPIRFIAIERVSWASGLSAPSEIPGETSRLRISVMLSTVSTETGSYLRSKSIKSRRLTGPCLATIALYFFQL